MQIIWKPEIRKLTDLNHWDKNPRKISVAQREVLKRKIEERGFHDVLKLNTKNVILSGNMRMDILAELGIELVNVLVPSRELTEEEETKIALESNMSDGQWEISLLSGFETEVLIDVGFDADTMKKITDSMGTEPEEQKPELKDAFENITFTLTHTQAEIVRDALAKAKEISPFPDTGNINKDANALERVCENYGI